MVKMSNEGPVTTVISGGVIDSVKLSVIVVVGVPKSIDSVRDTLNVTVSIMGLLIMSVLVEVKVKSLRIKMLVSDIVTVVSESNSVLIDVLTVTNTVPVTVLIEVAVVVVVVLLID